MNSILRGSSKVTSKGQVTIPQELRMEFGIEPGDIVYFITEDGKLVLRAGPIKFP